MSLNPPPPLFDPLLPFSPPQSHGFYSVSLTLNRQLQAFGPSFSPCCTLEGGSFNRAATPPLKRLCIPLHPPRGFLFWFPAPRSLKIRSLRKTVFPPPTPSPPPSGPPFERPYGVRPSHDPCDAAIPAPRKHVGHSMAFKISFFFLPPLSISP